MARIVEILRSHRHEIRKGRVSRQVELSENPAGVDAEPDDPCGGIEDDRRDERGPSEAEPTAVDDSCGYFIEVGFPDKHIEGSPEVMAVAVPAVPERPGGDGCELKEGEVYFEPWPQTPSDDAEPPAPELVVYHRPGSQSARQFAALYEQLQKQVAGSKVLAFTPLAGSPWHLAVDVLLNLAVVAANEGKKTLVVELEVADSGVCRRLAIPRGGGLLDVVAGNLALEEAIRSTAIGRLAVLSPGICDAEPRSAGEIGRATEWILDWAQGRFDLVFVNVPEAEVPLGLGAYCRAIDCIFPVAAEAGGNSAELRSLVRELRTIEMVVPGILYQRAASA